jgi:hypothetical protein
MSIIKGYPHHGASNSAHTDTNRWSQGKCPEPGASPAVFCRMDPNGDKDGAGQRLDAAQQLATTNICLQVAGRNETDRFGRGMRLFFWNFLLN